MSTKLTPDEIKLRGSLLAKSKELLKLHKDLVSSKILTEEEFWEDRKKLLNSHEMILKQKKGIPSSFINNDLKPSIASASSDVKYILTPQIIESIFEQQPILKKAFNELVGSSLNEREFWLEYLKSKFFNESKSSSESGSNHLDSYYKEDTNSYESEESTVKVSSFCDISRSENDHISDYLRYERESVSNDPNWNSLRQINKHSLRVLQALKSDIDPLKVKNDDNKYIEIPDLQQVIEPEMAILNVKESQLFSIGKITESSEVVSKEIFQNIINDLDKNLTSTSSPLKLNYSQSKNLFSNFFKNNNFKLDLNNSNDNNNVTNSALESQDHLQIFDSSIELLRHFWKTVLSVPMSSSKLTPEKQSKLARIISVLELNEEKINSNENKRLGNLLETIRKAKQKYYELFK